MFEGKGLLIKIIDNKLNKLQDLNKDEITYQETNLLELANSLNESIDSLAEVNDELIDKIITDNDYSKKKTFRNNIIQLRDLLIGKRDYNLQVNFNKEHLDTYETFKDLLNTSIEMTSPGIISRDEIEEQCNTLLQQIARKEIINNLEFIETITSEYSAVDKDTNLIKIMKFVNEHNLHILKTPKKNGPLMNINFIFRPKLDERLQEILDKLGIEYKELPNYLVSELKRCDVDSVYETYQTIKKNKAESYGILHLIKKSNVLAKLILILYATPESVKDVVDSVKNKEGVIDITLLKILLNYTLPVFLVKENEYFEPKNINYVENINMLKTLGVNHKALINKTPLFMVVNNEKLTYTLDMCAKYNADKKLIINRLYKTLTLNPAIILENIEVLENYNVDVEEYFKGSNYNLLKTHNLSDKIKYFEKNKNLNTEELNLELLNKMLVGKVYRECVLEVKDIWSEQ